MERIPRAPFLAVFKLQAVDIQLSSSFGGTYIQLDVLTDNLINVGQMTKGNNVLFTEKGIYLQPKNDSNSSPKLIGSRGSDNLCILPKASDIG